MMNKKISGTLLAVIATATLAAGCSTDKSDNDTTQSSSATIAPTVDSSSSAETKEKPETEDPTAETIPGNTEKNTQNPAPANTGVATFNGYTVPLSVDAVRNVKSANGMRLTDPRTPGLPQPAGNLNFKSDPSKPFASKCDGTIIPTQKPIAFTFNCSNNDENLKSINWLVWEKDVAFGVAEQKFNDCTPNCASGDSAEKTVTVTLVNPVNGRFTQAIVDQGAPGTFTQKY